jgi:hypothetical protein
MSAAPIAGRSAAVTQWTGKEILIWGGEDWAQVFADGAAYDPATNTWRPLPAAPISARIGPAQQWTGKDLLIWGGTPGTYNTFFADGAAYTPETGTWQRMTTWTGRLVTSDVWTGKELVVWGGIVPIGGSSRTVEIKSADDGQRYVP